MKWATAICPHFPSSHHKALASLPRHRPYEICLLRFIRRAILTQYVVEPQLRLLSPLLARPMIVEPTLALHKTEVYRPDILSLHQRQAVFKGVAIPARQVFRTDNRTVELLQIAYEFLHILRRLDCQWQMFV